MAHTVMVLGIFGISVFCGFLAGILIRRQAEKDPGFGYIDPYNDKDGMHTEKTDDSLKNKANP